LEEVNKKILITGGAGFIGSHLCKALIGKNQCVICLDNLYSGSMQNIKDLLNNPNFTFIEHDIVDPIQLTDIKEIYNLACPASPVSYQLNPINTIKTCTAGVVNMLELAKSNKAKILQASTSEIYGDPLVHPQDEEYYGNVNTTGLRSCYDEGKRCAETLFSDYKRVYNLDSKIVRIFNTYGPNMMINDGRVISNFIVQSLLEKNLTINGNGSQSRSFMYVDDLIDGLISVMSLDKYLGPINIGNPEEISIKNLAFEILSISNSSSGLIYNNLPEDDPKRRKPDIGKIQNEISWRPKISLKEGLVKTIDYFKNNL
tara:strand:+ start:847 stop:1791 length:945 start_codon:yes stop_codon:yes gene_type:complete